MSPSSPSSDFCLPSMQQDCQAQCGFPALPCSLETVSRQKAWEAVALISGIKSVFSVLSEDFLQTFCSVFRLLQEGDSGPFYPLTTITSGNDLPDRSVSAVLLVHFYNSFHSPNKQHIHTYYPQSCCLNLFSASSLSHSWRFISLSGLRFFFFYEHIFSWSLLTCEKFAPTCWMFPFKDY